MRQNRRAKEHRDNALASRRARQKKTFEKIFKILRDEFRMRVLHASFSRLRAMKRDNESLRRKEDCRRNVDRARRTATRAER
jgi:hypothetical protein